MHRDLVTILRCPACGSRLAQPAGPTADVLDSGQLLCMSCALAYPIIGGVPRFVPLENYAGNFGFQWNRFRRTQLDSVTRTTISRDRFLRFTGWKPEELAGKRVLDVGCGAGRFAEVALSFGARVVAVDYSTAVDACVTNLGLQPRLDVVQGDIYHLPFAPETFDFVYCLGVLQHTPDVAGAFRSLPPHIKPGGRLAVDVYAKRAFHWLWPRYLLRHVTKRLPQEMLFRWVERAVPFLLPLSDTLRRIPLLDGRLRYLVPVANYRGVFPLNNAQLQEWALLDTFDMLSPRYDHPQSANTLRRWLERAGLQDVWAGRLGFVVGRGTKPAPPPA